MGDKIENEKEASSSFELKRTTKGVNVTVKIYSCDDEDKVMNAKNMAVKYFDELNKKYKQE